MRNLDFDEQIREFVKIKIESDCCQKYGICGEQYVSDINFDVNGKVVATRFRYMHTAVRYQDDFINDLILTRRATDIFSKQLVPSKKEESQFKVKHSLANLKN